MVVHAWRLQQPSIRGIFAKEAFYSIIVTVGVTAPHGYFPGESLLFGLCSLVTSVVRIDRNSLVFAWTG